MYRQFIARRLPLYFVGPVLIENRSFINTERLMLPLGDAKGDVVGLCGVTVPAPAAKWAAWPRRSPKNQDLPSSGFPFARRWVPF